MLNFLPVLFAKPWTAECIGPKDTGLFGDSCAQCVCFILTKAIYFLVFD